MLKILKFIEQVDQELYTQYGIINMYEKYCGYLPFEWLFSTDHVYIAACEAASGYTDRFDTSRFMKSSWANANNLAESVKNWTFKPKYYKTRKITERGHVRVIRPPTFECKVVQKVICEYQLRPLLEPKCIQTTYASIRGKGTEKMHQRLLKDLNQAITLYGEDGLIIIIDFKSYFESIQHNILFKRLDPLIADKRIIALIQEFYKGYTGLSLGDELSQLPATWFPSLLDHTIKDQYAKPYFYRFMDDSLYIANSVLDKNWFLKTANEVATTLGLTIKPEKTKIIPLGRSFSFCKERYQYNKETKQYYRLINPQTLKIEKRKLRYFNRMLEIEKDDVKRKKLQKKYQDQYRSWRGCIVSKPNTYHMLEETDKIYMNSLIAKDK